MATKSNTAACRQSRVPPHNGEAVVPNNVGDAGSPASHSLAVDPGSPFTGSAAFRFRTDECPACDRATQFTCETCWNSGMVDAACCECGNVLPLNADGLCRFHSDESQLSTAEHAAKWMMPGILRRECGQEAY